MTRPRCAYGSVVRPARPFLVFVGSDGRLAVRVGRELLRATEAFIGAAVLVRTDGRGLQLVGEGVVQQDGTTVRISA